jgi:hypothetical protein
MNPHISQLDGSDWSLLREQVATVQALVKKRYGGAVLDQSTADLAALQRVLDGEKYDYTQVAELKAIAAVLGNVLHRQLGFEWVVAEDERGREPALRLKTANPLVIFPMRLVVSAARAGDRVDIEHIFRNVKQDAQRARTV